MTHVTSEDGGCCVALPAVVLFTLFLVWLALSLLDPQLAAVLW